MRGGETIPVSVKDGKVSPATHREPENKGDTVKLVVNMAGVNIEKPTRPGQPLTITFLAKDRGIYEVQAHDSGLQLLQLEVR